LRYRIVLIQAGKCDILVDRPKGRYDSMFHGV
jgi:hypothetical protein